MDIALLIYCVKDWYWKAYLWYHDHIKDPLKYKFPFRQLGTAWYWVRTHTYNKYHMIDCRNVMNGYEWGWKDRSELLLFAMMSVLVDFVEKEKAFDCHVDWRSAEEAGHDEHKGCDENRDAHAAAKKEMLTIYNWWTKGRKEEHDAYERLCDEAYKDFEFSFKKLPDGMSGLITPPRTAEQEELSKKSWEVEEQLDKKDNEMMTRLVTVSGYMWT